MLWNRASERVFGWSAEEVTGKQNPTVPPEYAAQVIEMRELAARGERQVVHTRRRRRDGALVDIVLTVTGLRDAAGEVRYTVGILHDLTELNEVRGRARGAEERSRVLLDHVTELAVLFVDAEGLVRNVNRGAELLLGATADELTGAGLSTVLEEDAILEREQRERATREMRCTRRDGTRFWADVEVTPIHGLAGEVTDYVVLLRDVSGRRREHERERRRVQQSASIIAFAHRATLELSPEAVAEAAVEHIAAAMQSTYTEIARPDDSGAQLAVAFAFGWGKEPMPKGTVDLSGPSIYTEALSKREAVARELTESDFALAPHLRDAGVTWGAVVAVRLADRVCTIAAFNSSAGAEDEIYPMLSVAAMVEAISARRHAEQALADRDRTLTMILDQMPAIVWTVDADLTFTTIRGGGLRALNALPERGSKVNLLDVVAFDGPAHTAVRRALAGESSWYLGTYQTRTYENRVEPLRDAEKNVIGAMNLAIDITERRRDEEALRASREELRRLSAHINNLQEEERRRIAHELHDELGQRLTALRMETSLLPHKLGKRGTPAASAAIESMIELIDETIVTVRRVATELRPAILDDFGFRAALELELAGLQKRAGIRYSIVFEPDDLKVERELATTLYRIAQESLTNVARHANATFVSVSVELRGSDIVLEIADNGRGIMPSERSSSSSLGLLGIRERAYAVGGEADVRTREEGGTVVSVRLPAGARA